MSTIAAKIQALIDLNDERQIMKASDALGIPRHVFKFYVDGRREPSTEQLVRLAAAFGVRAEYFTAKPDPRVTCEQFAAFVRRVEIARRHQGLPYEEAAAWIAERINSHAPAIRAFMQGREVPRVATADQIAAALGVKTTWLLGEGSDQIEIEIAGESRLEQPVERVSASPVFCSLERAD